MRKGAGAAPPCLYRSSWAMPFFQAAFLYRGAFRCSGCAPTEQTKMKTAARLASPPHRTRTRKGTGGLAGTFSGPANPARKRRVQDEVRF
jgi:hypothetical protein